MVLDASNLFLLCIGSFVVRSMKKTWHVKDGQNKSKTIKCECSQEEKMELGNKD